MEKYELELIIGICWCIGFIMKKWIKKMEDKYIPTALVVIGVLLSMWIHKGISPEVILEGMVSALASTGVHQNVKQMLKGE